MEPKKLFFGLFAMLALSVSTLGCGIIPGTSAGPATPAPAPTPTLAQRLETQAATNAEASAAQLAAFDRLTKAIEAQKPAAIDLGPIATALGDLKKSVEAQKPADNKPVLDALDKLTKALETQKPADFKPLLDAINDLRKDVRESSQRVATGQQQGQGGQQGGQQGSQQQTGPGGVPFQLGCGPTKNVGEVQQMVGLSIVCLGTEFDAYTWRSVPIKVNAIVPAGWIATLHLAGDRVVVTETPGTYEIVAATFRRVKGYPQGDAVHNRCELLHKEQVFGASQTPSFPVFPHGFTCDGQQAQTNAAQGTNPQTGGDPQAASRKMAVSEIQCNPSCGNRLSLIEDDEAVKLGSGACVNVTLPANVKYDSWDGSRTVQGQGGTIRTCEATFRRN